jgi:hypothetical protein
MAVLEEFHRGDAHLAGVNQAYITLLPKSEDVLTAGRFRPNSIQNCIMKIITRILTSRLQPFIEQLVAFEQSGFIAEWCITDNFLYAAELVQCYRLRKTPMIALKLDFRKAFDSVRWSSLDAVLESRGFGVLFRSWVRDILRTGKAAVLLNGVPGRWIESRNGLRQGDPLSPYLYLIIVGHLRQLVTREDGGLRLLHPLVNGLPCPIIQYAEDTMILVRATHSQVALLKAALDTFFAATGLTINYHKSTFVPICVPTDDAAALAMTMGCAVASFLQTYLGLPLSDRKLPSSALDFLAERISTRIPRWRLGTLDPGSRLTLTSMVLSALPSFAMSVLPIPKGTICRMDRPRRAMFWNESTICSGGDCLVS